MAIATGVDVDGLRRLHNYGDLDDTGVVRAYEQTRTQRFGHLALPDYLKRIRRIVCVVDDGDSARRHSFDDTAGEIVLFDALRNTLDTAVGPCVAWQLGELGPLQARAMLCRQVLPAGMVPGSSTPVSLAGVLGIAPSDGAQTIESEVTTLFGLDDATDSPQPEAVRAVNRYRLWLAVQHSRGVITASEHEARLQALTEAAPA